jgi:hypothetical protein
MQRVLPSVARRFINHSPRPSRSARFVSADEAVSVIKSSDRVFIHSVAMAPQPLIHGVYIA